MARAANWPWSAGPKTGVARTLNGNIGGVVPVGVVLGNGSVRAEQSARWWLLLLPNGCENEPADVLELPVHIHLHQEPLLLLDVLLHGTELLFELGYRRRFMLFLLRRELFELICERLKL